MGVQSLGWEDPLEEGLANHSSIPAWRIPMDRGAWQATAHGVAKSRTRLSDLKKKTKPDKGLISKMYKKLIQHNSKKFRSLYFKYGRDFNRVLFTEDILKRSLISLLIIQDMKIKHTMTYHFTPVRMIVIRKTRNPSQSW